MLGVTDLQTLEKRKAKGALIVLFGGAHCSVCHSLRPRLTAMVEQHYPAMQSAYVDCGISPDICAQHGVFSLPAVKVFIDGMLVTEDARVFSIAELMQRIERPYQLWQQSAGE